MYSFLYFYFDFHVFCCWIFSPFVTPLAYVSYLCTLLLSLGWFFISLLSLTLICLYMVMSKAEGARCGRPMSAVSLSIQLFWSPATVNAWKCLACCFFFGHEVLMMRLHISFCRLVSSRAKVTCHMRIVVGGDFVWFFCCCCCFASFFLFDIPRIRLKLESQELCQVRLCHGYLNLQLKKFLVMDVMYDLALCKANVSAVWESQRWVI